MDEQKLVACDFCGKQEAHCGSHGGVWQAHCSNCGAKGPTRYTEAEARAAWNRRTATAEPVAWLITENDGSGWREVEFDKPHTDPEVANVTIAPLFLHPAPTAASDKDARDAKRYRWLRERNAQFDVNERERYVGMPWTPIADRGERLDAAIDAAMKDTQ